MKPFYLFSILLLTLASISCRNEESDLSKISDLSDISDLSGKPDKIIQNVHGKLTYNETLKIWSVSYDYQEIYFYQDLYMVRKINAENVPELVEGKRVLISGSCYKAKVPWSLPERTMCYSIIISDLREDNSPEPDKILEKAPGILAYNETLQLWSVTQVYGSQNILHDPADMYLIETINCDNIPELREGGTILISGDCYKTTVPWSITGGVQFYNIIVTDLKYK